MANTTSQSYLPPGLPMPAPSPDGVDRGFYEGLSRNELTVQRCNKCHTFQFAPELIQIGRQVSPRRAENQPSYRIETDSPLFQDGCRHLRAAWNPIQAVAKLELAAP